MFLNDAGNKVKGLVEIIMTYRLILDIGHYLDLLKTLYVPSLSRNLISLSKLVFTIYLELTILVLNRLHNSDHLHVIANLGRECFASNCMIKLFE